MLAELRVNQGIGSCAEVGCRLLCHDSMRRWTKTPMIGVRLASVLASLDASQQHPAAAARAFRSEALPR